MTETTDANMHGIAERLRAAVENVTLFEWVNFTRAFLANHYPGCEWATLVIRHGEGVPSTVLSVTPSSGERASGAEAAAE